VADTFGRRISVIIGALVVGVAFLLEGSLPLFATILVAEGIRGIGETFLSGATEAWLAGEVGEEAVGQVYIRSAQVNRVVGLLGVAASVWLASIRLNLPPLVGGGLYVALGIILLAVMPEHGFRPQPHATSHPWRTLGQTLLSSVQAVRGNTVLVLLLGVSLILGAASEGYDRLWEAHLLTSFHLPALGTWPPVVWFGLISAASRLLSLAATAIARPHLETLSTRPRAIARWLGVSNVATIVCIVAFALTGSLPLALGAVLLKWVIASLVGPLYDTFLVQNTAPQWRATMISMMGQANSLGQIAGGPGIGALGVASLRVAIAATGLMLAPAQWLYARLHRHRALAPKIVGQTGSD
jgi:DHA3 family tetracycline resistance protein-like MFS transporter